MFSIGGSYINTVVTSKEEILKASRELVRQNGSSDINIRAVAAACGVSVGSIYNYFSSKMELVSATVEDIWGEIFHSSGGKTEFRDIISCISWLYQRMEYGREQYPGFFKLHSMGFMQDERADAKRKMQQAWGHIIGTICHVLKHDTNIRPQAFDEQLTPEKLANTLFSLMLSAMVRNDYDSSTVLIIVRKILSNIRPQAFDEQLTPEKLANTLFSLMLSAMVRNDYDSSTVLIIVRKILY